MRPMATTAAPRWASSSDWRVSQCALLGGAVVLLAVGVAAGYAWDKDETAAATAAAAAAEALEARCEALAANLVQVRPNASSGAARRALAEGGASSSASGSAHQTADGDAGISPCVAVGAWADWLHAFSVTCCDQGANGTATAVAFAATSVSADGVENGQWGSGTYYVVDGPSAGGWTTGITSK